MPTKHMQHMTTALLHTQCIETFDYDHTKLKDLLYIYCHVGTSLARYYVDYQLCWRFRSVCHLTDHNNCPSTRSQVAEL